ncbi:hypothetical protein LMB83_00635 [Limosilactobacillus reuteri]|uniref:hypothetical protein n=1 Tax=Limosilactobacillus reuteri TaxID=1598 RepID=UPI001E6179AE|nr:hypothetical protein [Limosilactobacillus reuteri]MCC4410563.1 hypothetical protein [Limosilactobacillus reuteri]
MVLKYSAAIDLRNDNLIPIEELITLDNNDEILKNLGCPICKCRLVLKHLSSSRGAYLSTKPGCNHSDTCNKRVEVKLRKERFKAIAHDDIYLTPKAQHARAVNFARRIMNSEKRKNRYSKKGLSKKLSKTKRIGEKTKTVKGVVYRASINPNIGRKINNEHVRLSAATPINVERFINRTIEFGGFLEKLIFGKESVIMVVSINRSKASIVMDPAFFRQSSKEYKDSLMVLKKFLDTSRMHPLITAIVDVVPSITGKVECLVRIDSALCFDGLSLGIYLYKNNMIK